MAVGLYLLSARLEERPLAVWPVGVFALVIGGYLTIRFAAQRQEIARRVREAEEGQERLQVFLGMVAHDLAGGLTNVLAGAELLSQRVAGTIGEEERVAGAAIAGGTRQMRRLLDDLRTASTIGTGRFDVRAAPMDLVSVARQVMAQLQVTTDRHSLTLESGPRLAGAWDRERITQLLTNLVSNAIKYSPDGGEVRLGLRPVPEGAVICVRDHGVGISPEQREFVFQPYSRLQPRQEVPGTGLGLWIAKAIVEAHGGRIWVESEVGKGSAFLAVLPSTDQSTTQPGPRQVVRDDRRRANDRATASRPNLATVGQPSR